MRRVYISSYEQQQQKVLFLALRL